MPRTSCWVRQPLPTATLRLLCVGAAGSGASAFQGWRAPLAPAVEVVALRLPGRESRLRERPYSSMADAIAAMTEDALALNELPVILYGHCFGALLAYELAHELARERGRLPQALVVAAQRPPDEHAAPTTASLTDSEFLTVVRSMGGTPAEVLASSDLLALLLPTLRADFELAASYQYSSRAPLAAPIVAIRPRDEAIDMTGWARHTRGAFRLVETDDGHFMTTTPPTPVLALTTELGKR